MRSGIVTSTASWAARTDDLARQGCALQLSSQGYKERTINTVRVRGAWKSGLPIHRLDQRDGTPESGKNSRVVLAGTAVESRQAFKPQRGRAATKRFEGMRLAWRRPRSPNQ